MIHFLVDAQLPPQLARALAEADYQAECVEDAQGPAIARLRIGNAAIAGLLTWFLPIPAVIVRLQNGGRLIEIR